jgi:hypothetical protein
LRGVDETHYSVRGMHIAMATAALSKLPGYVSAEFDLKSSKAMVKGSVVPQAAVNALTKVGYPTEVDAD